MVAVSRSEVDIVLRIFRLFQNDFLLDFLIDSQNDFLIDSQNGTVDTNRKFKGYPQGYPDNSKFVQTYVKIFQQYKKYLSLSLCLLASN